MEKYTEYVYNYNFYTKEFTRFGKTEWTILYTATSIICNGRYMRIYKDYEFSYKLRLDGIYSCYSPKEFVRQFFNKEYNCGSVVDVWATKICHWVYIHGRSVKSLARQEPYFFVNNKVDNKQFLCNDFLTAKKLTQDYFHEYTNTGYNYHCQDVHLAVFVNRDYISKVVEVYEKDNKDNKVIIEAV